MKARIIILVILILSLFLANYHQKKIVVETPRVNKIFPYQLGEWTGKDLEVSKSAFKLLKPEELLMRVYKDKKTGQKLSLAIVLTNERSRIHDPEVCYRLQGIEMKREEILPIDKDELVKHVFGSRKKEPYDIIYWYTDLNQTFTDRAKFMKHIALSKFFDKQMVGFALVVVIAPETNNKEVYDFSSQVNDFLIKLGQNKNEK